MHSSRHTALGCLGLAAVLVCLLGIAPLPASGQTRPQTQRKPDEDVERVNTELVQTDVTVIDKDGRVVEGLKAEQFELKVDGKPVPVSFSERVMAGSAEERSQIEAAASGGGKTPPAPPAGDAARGRTVFFFVDNLHLDLESSIRVRKLLLRAIDELGPADRAAVATVGSSFVSTPLTSDKAELKAAVERIAQKEGMERDMGRPPMSEYQALSIIRGDTRLLDYFIEQILREFPTLGRLGAEAMVRSRTENITQQAATLSANTFIALENVIRAAAGVPGRKLVFFVSGGFIVEGERSNAFERLGRVNDMAAREGVLVYTLSAPGLVTGFPDASEAGGGSRPTPSSRIGEMGVQDVLYSLAAETGGRALVNSNDLDSGIRRALQETSVYYLLAWRPSREALAGGRFKRIEVSIVGRPDLKVLTRRNLAASVSSALARANAAGGTPAPAAVSPAEELLNSLAASYAPQQNLPASLVVVHRDAPAGKNSALTASVQVPGDALAPAGADDKAAALDFAAVVLDAQGKRVAGFSKRVSVVAGAKDEQHFHNFTAELPPGRYEVRAGARDAASGRAGTAAQWVEIPDTSDGRFALSSLMLAEHSDVEKPVAPKAVARRFAPTSRLRFLAYAYNAAPDPANGNTPDLDLKLQITRAGQPVQVPPLVEVLVEGEDETKRFPVAAEIPLDDFAPGEYTLQITVTDRLKKASATQQTTFIVVE